MKKINKTILLCSTLALMIPTTYIIAHADDDSDKYDRKGMEYSWYKNNHEDCDEDSDEMKNFGGMSQRMIKKLDLTPEQSIKFEEINSAHMAMREANRNLKISKENREEMRDLMMGNVSEDQAEKVANNYAEKIKQQMLIRHNFNRQIMDILDEDQKEKFMKFQRKNRRH